jgi:GTP-binding protein
LTATLNADVFLVGLPNSGKSKLMNTLTRAQLKEEAYPFSTQSPQIAVVPFSDYESLVICEMPSVYKASHEGRGLGTSFLKHVETGKGILFMLDPVSEFASGLQDGLETLREQLGNVAEALLNIPYAVVVNKMDLPEAKAKVEAENFSPKVPVFYISALTGEGLEPLKNYLKQTVVETQ